MKKISFAVALLFISIKIFAQDQNLQEQEYLEKIKSLNNQIATRDETIASLNEQLLIKDSIQSEQLRLITNLGNELTKSNDINNRYESLKDDIDVKEVRLLKEALIMAKDTVDEKIENFYKVQESSQKSFSNFLTILAIIVALLGLIGLLAIKKRYQE